MKLLEILKRNLMEKEINLMVEFYSIDGFTSV